jgi:hypothetical protein
MIDYIKIKLSLRMKNGGNQLHPRVKSNGSLFGEPSNGEGGLENIN